MRKEPFSLQGRLSDITFERPVSKITYDTKNSRTDLTILLKEEKTLVNVEAYTSFSLESLKKSNLYILRGYSSQLKKGHKYQTMNPFIQINLVDHVEANLLQEKIIQRYRLEEQGYPLTDDIQIYYIRLDLLDKLNYNVGISDEEFLDILRYLKANSEEERDKLKRKWRTIMTMDEYMNALLSDEVMNEERSIFKKARDYGREEGIDIGKKEIAKDMLLANDPLELIQRITKLTKEEILNIKNNM